MQTNKTIIWPELMGSLLNRAKINVDIIDSHYNVVFVDNYWKRRYGDPAGKKCFSYFMGKKGVCPSCGIKKSLSSKRIVVSEEKLAKEEGRPIKVVTVPFKDHKGRWMVAEINIDLSDQKKAEESLRRSEERYKALSELSRDLIFLIGKDYRVQYLNCFAASEFNRKPSYFIGKTLSEFFPDKISSRMKSSLARVFSSGESYYTENITLFPKGELWLDTWLIPLKDEYGITTSVLGISRDITSRKRMEDALKNSKARLEFLYSSTPVVVYSLTSGKNNKLRINFVSKNCLSLTGFTDADILKKPDICTGRIHPEDRKWVIPEIVKAVKEGSFKAEYRYLHKNGNYIWLYDEMKVMGKGTGSSFEIIGYLVDITEKKKAESDLREREELYRAVVEDQADMVCRVNTNGCMTFVNKAFLEYFKKPLIGKRWGHIIYRDDIKRVEKSVGTVGPGKRILRVESRVIRHDGEIRWISWINRAILDNKGRVSGVQSTGRDITELKEAEESLLESEKMYRAIVENSNDIIFMLDMSGRIVFCNNKAEHATGYKLSEWKGRHYAPLIMSEDAPRILKQFKSAISGKSSQFQAKIIKKDGSLLYLSINAAPMIKSGKAVGTVSFGRDITDAIIMQEDLRETQERYRMLSESSKDYIFVFNRDLNFTYLNKAASKEFRGRKLVGSNIRNAFSAGVVDGMEKRVREVLMTGKPSSSESMTTLPSKTLWLDTWLIPLKDAKGQISSIMGISRDITSRKKLEESLKSHGKQLEEMVEEKTGELISTKEKLYTSKRLADIGALAASVAHEIRNPLAAISAAAYNIRRKTRDPSIIPNLDNVEKKILETDHIINNLLFYARIKAPEFKKITVSEVLKECIESAKVRYADYRVRVVENYGTGKPYTINADPLQIAEVFNNIINNAYESIQGKNGVINVSCSSSVLKYIRYARICVEDNGIGIAHKDMDKLFEPFFTTKARGTGLGLAVCKRIIKLHHGNVDIQSKAGHGTKVLIYLALN